MIDVEGEYDELGESREIQAIIDKQLLNVQQNKGIREESLNNVIAQDINGPRN